MAENPLSGQVGVLTPAQELRGLSSVEKSGGVAAPFAWARVFD